MLAGGYYIRRTSISFVYSSRIATTRLRILYTHSCRAGFLNRQVTVSPDRKPFRPSISLISASEMIHTTSAISPSRRLDKGSTTVSRP